MLNSLSWFLMLTVLRYCQYCIMSEFFVQYVFRLHDSLESHNLP